MRRFVIVGIAAWVALCLTLCSAAVGQTVVIRPIAVSGDTAPQTNTGVTFDPTIGNISYYVAGSETSGRAAFNVVLAGPGINSSNSRAIYVGQRNSLSQLARTGSAAPDLSGWNYSFLNEPRLFGSYVTFAADITNTSSGTARQGYFGGTPGNIHMLGMPTMPAPGLPGVTYTSPGPAAMNATGAMYFSTGLQGSGVTTANNQALYGGTPSSLSVFRRSGTQADGLATGINYKTFGNVSLASGGALAFSAQLATPGGASSGTGIFHSPNPGGPGGGGGVTPVAHTGDAAPGLPGYAFDILGDPRLNASGDVLFRASITGPGLTIDNNAGLWAGPVNAPKLVMRDGGPAPAAGAGASYTSPVPGNYFMADTGKVTFISGLKTPAMTNAVNAIWFTEANDEVDLLAKVGDPAPGTTAHFSSFGSLAISPTGMIAFNASLDTPTFQFGTWVTDASGEIRKLVRTGDVLNIPGVGTKTVSDMIFGGQVTNDALVFNSSNELVTRLRFTDNSGGVFSLAVPEPGSITTLGLSATLLWGTRRKDARISRKCG